jgi:hypothetical protein
MAPLWPHRPLFASKNINKLSLIDRSFNWLNLATYPKLNSGMKYVQYCSDCTRSMQEDVHVYVITKFKAAGVHANATPNASV